MVPFLGECVDDRCVSALVWMDSGLRLRKLCFGIALALLWHCFGLPLASEPTSVAPGGGCRSRSFSALGTQAAVHASEPMPRPIGKPIGKPIGREQALSCDNLAALAFFFDSKRLELMAFVAVSLPRRTHHDIEGELAR